MSARLSKTEIVSREVLERLVEVRFHEAKVLCEKRFFAGAVYLAGYAVECELKVAICVRLDLDMLPATFRSHDLELLLLHSGLQNKLKMREEVAESFKKICGMWNGKMDLRYEDPNKIGENDAHLFLEWVGHSTKGVLPWLREMI